MKKDILKKRKKVICDVMNCKEYQPMRAKELAVLLQIPAGKRKDLHQVLDALLEEGRIEISKRGKYQICGKKKENTQEFSEQTLQRKNRRQQIKEVRDSGEYITGTFIGHPKGFGFVETKTEGEEDIFIPESEVHDAIHLDEVQVRIMNADKGERISRNGKRREGSIVKVLSRNTDAIVGTYQKNSSFGFVIADNPKIFQDIFVSTEHSMGAVTGDKVVVSIKSYGSAKKSPEGKITEILGHFHEAGVDVLSIARGFMIPMEFPERVLNQTQRISEHLIEGDFYQRRDLRDWTIVTIDGEDAKDLDDGVSLTKEGDIYHLGVHIADVSNYVQYNSALDREALKRGTSVYLVDRVIPMLPPKLSNGICSLNEGQDRLALSCLMDIDTKGNVIAHEIVETVIRVKKRMTYTDVKKILLEEDAKVSESHRELVPLFFLMQELSTIIRAKREKRGAIDFDFPESKIILNSQGKPIDIYRYEHNVATKIIEDFMLIANETVAQEYALAELPFVYRSHEVPDEEKMEAVLLMIHANGVKVKKTKKDIHPKEIQKILKEIQGTSLEPLYSRLLLRSMKQAKYTPDCIGHFGLAAKYYCHFTSPIRRYPDLQIHRIIKENIHGKLTDTRIIHYNGILEEVARQSSAMERRAEEAERETDKLKKTEYMAERIGEVFTGVISGVTEWGIYVELSNSVEGLVHVNTLRDDFYIFDKANYRLVGEVTKNCYSLGQNVTVRVEDADLATKTVDFVLAKEMREDEYE